MCSIKFIYEFVAKLESAFDCVAAYYKEECTDVDIHTLNTIVAKKRILMPFVVKAMMNGIDMSDDAFRTLGKSFTALFLRDRIVRTRAGLTSRMRDVFAEFDDDIKPVISRIDDMKTQDIWWGYWNTALFRDAMATVGDGQETKILLWLHKNHLAQEQGKNIKRFDAMMRCAELEHIAPQYENAAANNGYFPYHMDNEKSNWWSYVHYLGNTLLLSTKTNKALGNDAFPVKWEAYTENLQQQKVRQMTLADKHWTLHMINKRREKIVDFISTAY